MSRVAIRPEREGDGEGITRVTVAAFRTLEISNHTEQFVIEHLRAAGTLMVSLVAEEAHEIVGHIAFSPVRISDGSSDWYGLGPLSVRPDRQRKGIGSALVEAGLDRLRSLNAKGCCLVGHPEYYRRFGFAPLWGLRFEGAPAEVFLAVSFGESAPQGVVCFDRAFLADGPPPAPGF